MLWKKFSHYYTYNFYEFNIWIYVNFSFLLIDTLCYKIDIFFLFVSPNTEAPPWDGVDGGGELKMMAGKTGCVLKE